MSPTSPCFKGCERRGANIEISRRDVRFWRKADMAIALTNVRFWEQSGHGDFRARCLLLTQSGHERHRIDAMQRCVLGPLFCGWKSPMQSVGEGKYGRAEFVGGTNALAKENPGCKRQAVHLLHPQRCCVLRL